MGAVKFYISENLGSVLNRANVYQQQEISEMLHFYKDQYLKVSALHPFEKPSTAAGFQDAVQKAIDEKVKEEEESGTHKVYCGKGCSFCCHLHVDISEDEAHLLTDYAEELEIKIDYNYLKRQLVEKPEDFKELPFAYRKCMFLDNKGHCKVYKHRPVSCRKLISVSEPKFCDTKKHKGAQVLRLIDTEAECIASGAMNAVESGSMAEMLLKVKS